MLVPCQALSVCQPQINRQTDSRPTDRQTDRNTDRQTDSYRQSDSPTYKTTDRTDLQWTVQPLLDSVRPHWLLVEC